MNIIPKREAGRRHNLSMQMDKKKILNIRQRISCRVLNDSLKIEFFGEETSLKKIELVKKRMARGASE
jgi:hypothetical protein